MTDNALHGPLDSGDATSEELVDACDNCNERVDLLMGSLLKADMYLVHYWIDCIVAEGCNWTTQLIQAIIWR